MNKIFSFTLILVLIVSCSDAPLLIEKKSADQHAISDCDNKPCPQISVDYILYTGEKEVITPINDKIIAFIVGSLYLGDPAVEPKITSVDGAIGQFVKDYWRDTSEFPDIHEYEAEVSIEETFRSKDFVSVALSQYSYIGGAHGNGTLDYVNFDIETGEIITIEQLVKDKKSLMVLAEEKLREAYDLPENERLNSTMFWFKDDAFHLSDCIGFEKGKMVIHYNQYEIASYADGPIDIEFSLEEVASFLAFSTDKK
ncbi:hypothetical protein SCB49_05155 [unidentified eubacterium SCB49]|nr:hypothetical protein SCB49_05155 [unidentified eubacterium SCB49]